LEESGRVEPKYDKQDPDILIHPGWEPSDDHYDSLFNFKWKPTSGGINYEMISKHGLK
jgi:Cft2 family RNA processing exonuclease